LLVGSIPSIDSLFLLKVCLMEGSATGKAIEANSALLLEVEGEGGLQWLEVVVELGRAERPNAEWPNAVEPAIVPLSQQFTEKQEVEAKAAAKAAKKAKKAGNNSVAPASPAPP
jgi:hypothetical protein